MGRCLPFLLVVPVAALGVLAGVDGPTPKAWHVGLLAAASAAWALAWWSLAEKPVGQRGVGLLLAGAVGLRLLAFASPLVFSDDVWRYVWEGGLVAESHSPYAAAPADPARAVERERWSTVFERINHPEVPAAYPPVTQAWHAGVVWLAGGPERPERSVLFLRLAALGLDLGVLALLAFVIAPARAGPLVAWGWCPWLALEFAGAAHFDVLGVLLLVAALGVRRELPRHALLALGILVKFLPVLALPWTLRVARRRWRAAGLVVGIVAAAYLATAQLAGGLSPAGSSGLGEYAFRWESWNLVYRWIEHPLGLLFERDESWTDPRRGGRLVVALAGLAFALVAWRRERDPWRGTGLVLAALFVLSPTLHPWYLAWPLAFFAVRPSLAWLWVFALCPLAYLPLEGWQSAGVWHEPAWFAPLVSVPFFAMLLWESRRTTLRA